LELSKSTLKTQAGERKPLPTNLNQERFTMVNGLELYGMGLEFKYGLVRDIFNETIIRKSSINIKNSLLTFPFYSR